MYKINENENIFMLNFINNNNPKVLCNLIFVSLQQKSKH